MVSARKQSTQRSLDAARAEVLSQKEAEAAEVQKLGTAARDEIQKEQSALEAAGTDLEGQLNEAASDATAAESAATAAESVLLARREEG